MDDILPRKILVEIQSHYFAAVAQAEIEYRSENADESALTAAFGLFLSRSSLLVDAEDGCAYEFNSNNFESRNVADHASGIFQIEVRNNSGKVLRRNGLLFQARNQWKGRDAKLLDQARQFDGNFRRAVIIDYSPTGYMAASAAHVVAANGDRKRLRQRMRKLADVLGIDFVHSRMGLPGLYWDPADESLHDPEARETGVKIRHVFSIEIRRLW